MRRNARINHRKKQKEIVNDKNLIRFLSIFVCVLLFLLIIVSIFYTIRNIHIQEQVVETASQDLGNATSSDNSTVSNEIEDTDATFTLAAIGDVLCHNTQYWDAYNSETGEYDFSYVFDDISYYTKTADICVGSLETTFGGAERGYSNYPTFNSPDSLAYALKKIGLDVISTAGNHALDTGFDGLCRTIDVLDDADISHLGTYKTQEEQEQILFKYVKGIKIAFINYTYGTNGIAIPSGKEFCVNLIDKDLIQKQIEQARSQNADIIVACMHWGTEYRTTADDEQKELADFLFQNGVDIIFGNHPHVLEPMEKRTVTLDDGSTKDGFVIYAFGNFISDQNAENTRNSIILNLTITKHTDGQITIDKTDYVPIYMYKNTALQTKKMKLLDINRTIANYEAGTDTSIGEATYNDLKVQLEKIKKIVGKDAGT